jgi:hypothetical protein
MRARNRPHLPITRRRGRTKAFLAADGFALTVQGGRMVRCLRSSIWAISLSLAFASGSAWAAAPGGLRGARVTEGQLEPDGKAFVTGSAGAELALEFGSKLTAKAGTRLEFGRTMKLAVGSGPDPMVPARVLTVSKGWIETEVPSGSRFGLVIIGPRDLRAIVAPGGRVTVIAEEGHATVATHEGAVLAGAKDKWRRLPVSGVYRIDERHPEGRRSELVGAVSTPVLSRSLLIAGSGDDSVSFMAWPAISGAVAYDVQISASGAPPRMERTTEPRLTLSGLPTGHFDLNVRGVDESDLPGPASETVALNVVGLEIPKTASRSEDGTIRLQSEQRIQLLGAQGLEVGYVGLEGFFPAPQSLGLVARRPISLVLRHPQSGEVLPLKLGPLNVKAQVGVGRHPADWPSEGLEIKVRLLDDQGSPVSDSYAASCRVTVNVEPVTPRWERQGATLRAVLERPATPGPWVVRIDVVDEGGASIGMDLAEIGYQAPRQARGATTKSR